MLFIEFPIYFQSPIFGVVAKISYTKFFMLQWCTLNINEKRHRFHCLHCVTLESCYCLLCFLGQKSQKVSSNQKFFNKNFFACTQLWCSQILSFCSLHSIISMLVTMMKIETYCNHVSHMEIPLNAQLSIQLRTWFQKKLLLASNTTRDALWAIIEKFLDSLIHFWWQSHFLFSLTHSMAIAVCYPLR